MSHKIPLADIQFISDFAAFARSKGGEEYSYTSNCNCALAQFLKASGRAENPWVGGWARWTDLATDPDHLRRTETPSGIEAALVESNRFSALTDRLEALLIDAPIVERG